MTRTVVQLDRLHDKTVSSDPATSAELEPASVPAPKPLVLLMMDGAPIKVALTHAYYSTFCMMCDSGETFEFAATHTIDQVKERIIAETRYSKDGAQPGQHAYDGIRTLTLFLQASLSASYVCPSSEPRWFSSLSRGVDRGELTRS